MSLRLNAFSFLTGLFLSVALIDAQAMGQADGPQTHDDAAPVAQEPKCRTSVNREQLVLLAGAINRHLLLVKRAEDAKKFEIARPKNCDLQELEYLTKALLLTGVIQK